MSETRHRIAPSYPPAQDILVEAAATVADESPTSFLGAAGIAHAWAILSPPPTHPANDDERTAKPRLEIEELVIRLTKLVARFGELYEQSRHRSMARDRETAKGALSDLRQEIVKVAEQLRDARAVLSRVQGVVMIEREAAENREFPEIFPRLVDAVTASDAKAREDRNTLLAYASAHPRHVDHGFLAELTCPWDKGLSEFIERVQAVATLILTPRHTNGRRPLRKVPPSTPLRGRALKRLQALFAQDPEARDFWKSSDTPGHESHLRDSSADELIALGVAADVPRIVTLAPIDATSIGVRFLAGHHVAGFGFYQAGERAWFPQLIAERLMTDHCAERITLVAIPEAVRDERRALVRVRAPFDLFQAGDVVSLPLTKIAQLDSTMIEPVDRVAIPRKAKQAPQIPLDWSSYSPKGQVQLVEVLRHFGLFSPGESIGLDVDLASHLNELGWVALSPAPKEG